MPDAPNAAEPDSRHQWRAQLLTRFAWALFSGGVPLVLYTLASANVAPSTRAAFVLLLLASAATALAKRLDPRARGLTLVISLLMVGGVLARVVGPSPGALLSLAMAVVLAAVIFGARSGAVALAASALSLLLLGLSGRIETGPIWARQLQETPTWIRMTATFALFGGLLVMLVSSALRVMERSLAETRASLGEALAARHARAQAEEALRENEERLRLALEGAQMGAWEWHFTTGAVTWTGQTESLLGLEPGGLRGTIEAFRAAVHPDDRAAVEHAISEALTGGRGTYQAQFRVSMDPPRWLEGKGQVYRNESGRPVLMRGTVADITARRRSEDALRESEERWRRISEATFEGIGFSQDGVLVDANVQLAGLLGYEVPELLGRPVTELVAPEDRARVAAAISSAQTNGYEHLALRKDGSTLLVETRARSLTHDGRRLRVTAVRDVSERQRLEAELRRRDTLAAMGSLVAGVAHEVRTPLFSLSATLDALDAGSGTPEQQSELKELLRTQLRRLANLMQDLLDYGRPPKLRRVRAGIREAVQHAARSCGSLAAQGGVELALALPEDLPEVEADLGRLEQVFQNLLANAIQHSPRGSTVSVTARPVADPRPGLTCAIEDEGSGLLPSDLEHLFDPFFSRRKGGTGMGLAIAQRFVEAHGGSLGARNRAGAGAIFTVFLPAAGESRAGGALA